MNQTHYDLLKSGVDKFNQWRKRNISVQVDLTGSDFSGMDLDEVNFSGALLHNSLFTKTSLIGADFAQANVSGCDFTGADCSLAIFTGAVGSNSKFINTNLRKAKMILGHFNDSDFTGANLSNSDFREARMDGAIVEEAKTSGASFHGVDINLVRTGNQKLKGAKFTPGFGKKEKSQYAKNIFTFVNMTIFFIFAVLSIVTFNKVKQTYGDPGRIISSYMNYSIGNHFMANGKIKDAVKYYNLAIKAKPDEAIYYYRLAQAYDELGDDKKFEENYQQFLSLKPDKKKIDEIEALIQDRKKKSARK
ncbi:MAG: pentapeptide repeat-containing protein [Firmicutes bacterium]|nr:pentapeptide repeat-containing protein [Bacillota bacterium]